jgi:hypothetical protein
VNSLGQSQTIIFDGRGNPVRESWTSADAPGKGSMVSTMEYTGDDKPLRYRNDVLLPGNRSRAEARRTDPR